MPEKFQAVVIGGGPGGYVCAIRLAQLGIKTACVESRKTLGGTCLNIGCIPSKSLLNLSENFHKAKHFSNLGIEVGKIKLNLKKMMKNKDEAVNILTKGIEFLFKKNKVTYYKGTGSFKTHNQISIVDDKNKKIVIEADKTIISTGSEPVSLPGIKFDEKVIISSTGALSLSTVPKKMIVVGGGYIGLEMGSVWSRLGAEVHVVEFLDYITPGMDKEISKEFMKILQKQGINFHLETKVDSIKKKNKIVTVSTTNKDRKKINFDCDVVLISVGRKPNTKNLNLEAIGVLLDDKKRINTVKRIIGNSCKIMVDANGYLEAGYVKKIDKVLLSNDIEWIEEPIALTSMDDLKYLKKNIKTKIAGYELEQTFFGWQELINAKVVDIAQPDAIWSGGITECLKIIRLCKC